MFDSLSAKKQIYPPAAFAVSIITLICGMAISKSYVAYAFAAALFLLFTCFGMFRGLWKITLGAVVCGCVIGGLAFLTSKNPASFYQTAVRAIILGICAVPMAATEPARLTRCMNQLKCPRYITLGMLITLRFIPFTVSEIKRIREAVKVRGLGVKVEGGYLYRTFFLPLIMRIIGISDSLSLSLETRAFDVSDNNATVYGKVSLHVRDAVFVCLGVLICALAGVIVWKMR